MPSIRLANRYAKSVLDLALEKDVVDAVTADVRKMSDIINGHSEFMRLLRSPIIHPAKKMPILVAVFEGRVHPILMHFMEILGRKHREEHLPEILKVYLERFNEMRHIKTVKITTTVTIEAELKDKIAESRRESAEATVEMESVVNPDLIGGYIIRYGDKQYDASVIRNLRLMRKEFEQNTYVKKY